MESKDISKRLFFPPPAKMGGDSRNGGSNSFVVNPTRVIESERIRSGNVPPPPPFPPQFTQDLSFPTHLLFPLLVHVLRQMRDPRAAERAQLFFLPFPFFLLLTAYLPKTKPHVPDSFFLDRKGTEGRTLTFPQGPFSPPSSFRPSPFLIRRCGKPRVPRAVSLTSSFPPLPLQNHKTY